MIRFASLDIPCFNLSASTTVRTNSMGLLDKLPFEILQQVLQLLDFRSLTSIRSLNFASRSVVDALSAFSYMTKYAASALRALSQTRLITRFAVSLLFLLFRTDRCIGCQRFGSFLFLLNCARCCYDCLERDLSLRAIDLLTAREKFGFEGLYPSGSPYSPQSSRKLCSYRSPGHEAENSAGERN